MTPRNETQAYRAMLELMDIARSSHSFDNAWLYALTWLAASRLVADDRFGNATTINDLISPAAWEAVPDGVLPAEAKALVWGTGKDVTNESATRTQALGIVTKLIQENGNQDWDVIDAPWHQPGIWRGGIYNGVVLAPELCNLTFDVLNAPHQSTIWIPFDPSGQLVIRAIRKGMRAIVAGPGRRTDTHLRLLLAIEGQTDRLSQAVVFDVPRDTGNKRDLTADFLIATPPFGMKIQAGSGWRQWEEEDPEHQGVDSLYQRKGPITQVQLDRSDSWSIAAFWPRVQQRALFLVSPSVLFAKGQEQSLRENLLLNEGALSAVTMLPTRQMSVSNMASAILLLDRGNFMRKVRFTDATDMTIESKSTMKFSRILDLPTVATLMTGDREDPKTSFTAGFEDIAMQDFNLVPARYLRQSLTGPRRPLRDLVEVIRAPVASKDITALTIQEAGFPELDGWREVSGPFAKTTSINSRQLEKSMLRSGDVLLSIKGTLGKSALVGRVPTVEPSFRQVILKQHGVPVFTDITQTPVVPSQSCIALRVMDHDISPMHLFLYLRSDDFKNQIDSLRVGASVAHVTPTTLLQEIMVPIPEKSELDTYSQKYDELCDLEASIEDAQQRTSEIRKALWPTHASDSLSQ